MKIVIIHLGRKGAGPVYTLEMAKALYALGHEVFYYASEDVENKEFVERQAFTKRFFKTYNSKFEYVMSVLLWYKIKRVIRSIKKDKPDVVYSCMNDLWSPFIFPKLDAVTRVKTIHDVGIHEGNISRFNKWWNITNFKDAEKFVILSRKFVPKLVERGIAEDRIVVIPHAGFDYYTEFSSNFKHITKNPVILFFGRIDQYKGISILMQALPKILKHYPDVILRIAGNGNLQTEMPLIDKYKNNIELYNRWIRDEEVGDLIEDATIVVLPYTHATQSGVIPLAYAFSKPVVATNVGCLDEQVIDGETGYLCEGANADALSKAILKMLDDPIHTKKMGISANEYMKKYLTWDASARIFDNFIAK